MRYKFMNLLTFYNNLKQFYFKVVYSAIVLYYLTKYGLNINYQFGYFL